MPNPKGQAGENQAVEYLTRQNYRILKRNFRSACGEVDIIMEKAGILVFAEVKFWEKFGFADLEYSITKRKIHRIVGTAEQFLKEQPEFSDYLIRFDVVFLSFAGDCIHHLENAFTENGFL